MSTAGHVPETWGLSEDDARDTLGSIGTGRLLVDAFARLRAADGTSHARSLGFMVSLCLVQGLVVVLAVATSFGGVGLSSAVADTIASSAPGPSGTVLSDAVEQARRVGRSQGAAPLLLGVLGLVFTATIAMGQTERSLNRLYGVERDRRTAHKYRRALVLALTIGPLFSFAFLLLGFGPAQGGARPSGMETLWEIARWPVALGLVVAALALLLRFSPNRHQPGAAWLAFGAGTAVVLWSSVTILLGFAFRLATTFPETYGPLAGVVALLLWTYASALSILYGVAVAAELEAVRATRGADHLARDDAHAVSGRAAVPA